MPYLTRKNDASFHEYLRRERLYKKGTEWFFAIRGNGAQGPYVTQEEAELALNAYVRLQSTLQKIDEYA